MLVFISFISINLNNFKACAETYVNTDANQEFKVVFNSNGGNFVPDQHVQKNSKLVQPKSPVKGGNKNIFAGWYYGEKQWDFINDIVTSNITLIAKWVGLECKDANATKQYINDIQIVNFNINIENAQISWFVNNVKQEGQNSNSFSFKPYEECAEYNIHCVVNNVESKKIGISVLYALPTKIETALEKVVDGIYTFSIKDGHYYDPNQLLWYKTIDAFTNDSQMIGLGATCLANIESDCFVYAVYDGKIISNKVKIETPSKTDSEVPVIIGSCIVVATLAIIVFVISKKRYNNYY